MSLWDESAREPDARRERNGGRVVLLVLVGLALLVGGGYAAAYLAAGDKVPRGTTVAGIDIGGRTQAVAAQALEEGLADKVDAPITVTVDDRTEVVQPADAGLSVDYLASVADAGGEQSWEPQRLWDYYTGGDDLDAVVSVDDTKLDALVERLGGDLGSDAVDGAVDFRRGEIVVTDPVVGEGLDPGATREALVSAYLSDEADVALTLTDIAPDIDMADVQAALDDFANPALSSSVTLVFGDSPVRLQPRDFARVLGMKAEGGVLVPALDTERLTALVSDQIGGSGAPVDASYDVVDGKPRVVPAKPGVTYEPSVVTDTFLTLVTQPEGERQMDVEATVVEADLTTKEARALGIRERVSSFTTYFPYAEYRNINIGRAAEIVNGTVLEPGETFSLNDVVGERTRENGFTEGFIISDGIFKEDLGGGVSQMATTTFNAAFFAGLKDVEHKPHSFYIDRYPVGREATVAFGAIDLRFQNDTDSGVLVEATLSPSTPSSQGVLTVSIYSTKTWDITTATSDRYAYVSPATRTLDTPDCYPNTGYSGFQVDVWRYFRRPGSDDLVREEKFHTDYTASDTVICRPPGSID
ncbi:vanomycin resistance protein VanB [Nocardioides psychrotolerans]|uniref:Vancomycin resistance protein YoaR, contains peptidoglycan-binding and VanW domains n=1 Tax=Nocardioides psychrotolerans TaxID=1005945 RepID=A0A1I3IVR7_9ACTN|nr:VanW family protein [Nocardioides psychrotolerans]GEP40373.1 vanomycin resistance protein VanB [Nocardioides psychrotolerans]SFI51990.1 Vancomycin resistance protein YoaR, contains peptidoglycan-binding and VanW domains [Nocardioides psychrotolerans]